MRKFPRCQMFNRGIEKLSSWNRTRQVKCWSKLGAHSPIKRDQILEMKNDDDGRWFRKEESPTRVLKNQWALKVAHVRTPSSSESIWKEWRKCSKWFLFIDFKDSLSFFGTAYWPKRIVDSPWWAYSRAFLRLLLCW